MSDALYLQRLATWVADHSPGEDARVEDHAVVWTRRWHEDDDECVRVTTFAEAREALGY